MASPETLGHLEGQEQQRTALESLPVADISKRPESVASALRQSQKANEVAGRIVGTERTEQIQKDNPYTKHPDTLSKDQEVAHYQGMLYANLGIDKNTNANNIVKKFGKGIIDGLLVGNAEIIMLIKNEGIEKFMNTLWKQISTVEGIGQILKAVGLSLWDLATGDAYERGKSLAELGLITTGAGAAGSLAKYAGKHTVQASAKIRGETIAKNAVSQTLHAAGRTVEIIGTGLQLPAKGVKKVAEGTVKTIGAVSETTGISATLRAGARIGGDVYERSGTKKVVEGTKNAVSVAVKGLAAIHIVGSADRNGPKTLASQRGVIDIDGKSVHPEPKPENMKNTTNEPTPHEKSPEKSISPEKLLESKVLYEKYPYLTDYKEWLGELTLDRMVGIGNNGVIIKHPTLSDKVVKISNGEIDSHKLKTELGTHQKIIDIVDAGYANKAVPLSARVPALPYIEKINGKDALILQYIDGQSFMTKAFIDSLERDIQTYGASKYKPTIDEIGQMRSISDYQVMDFLEKKYKIGNEVFLKEGGNAVGAGVWEANREVMVVRYAADGKNPISKLRGWLYENGIELTDTHGGNFMYGRDGRVWAIDFGLVGVARIYPKK